MASVVAERITKLLKDHELFRQACYIDGAWVGAGAAARLPVDNPATGEIVGTVPRLGAPRRARRSRRPRAPFPRGGKTGEGTRRGVLRRWFELMMANQDDLARLMTTEQGKPLAESRARSPTPRRFSSGSAKKPSASTATPSPRTRRQAHRRHQAADRRRRVHHAVELSARDDHAQGRPGDRGRLHGRAEARVADAVLRARARRARRARRRAEGRVQRHHRTRRPRSAAS